MELFFWYERENGERIRMEKLIIIKGEIQSAQRAGDGSDEKE